MSRYTNRCEDPALKQGQYCSGSPARASSVLLAWPRAVERQVIFRWHEHLSIFDQTAIFTSMVRGTRMVAFGRTLELARAAETQKESKWNENGTPKINRFSHFPSAQLKVREYVGPEAPIEPLLLQIASPCTRKERGASKIQCSIP